ncbi:MAG: peptidase dipeptidylpeptidase domain protein [Candidatus Solibacter sp.]|nr:peptidase dipeptidylpeptidase domain protein [Candidatus Solibacter sp.]
MLALALCSVGAVVTLMGRLASGPQVEQKKIQISTGDASESYPSISADGKRLAYSARESSRVSAFHVFVRELPSGKPLQLTKGEGNDIAPVWSPDGGTLAFLRVLEGKRECIVIPADGGEERKIAELGPAGDASQAMPEISWNPDGKSLIVVQNADKQLPGLATLALDSGKLVRITNPAEGSEGDSTPAVAPSGSSIAFVRHTPNDGADIFLCDSAGAGVRRLTFDDRGIRGIAWSRDGQDLIYSANRAGGWRIWRVQAYGGSPREYTLGGKQAYYPTVGRNRLAYTDSPTVSAIWQATLGSDPVEEHAVLRSTGRERMPVWSPDGTRIANIGDQSGSDEIYVSDARGQNRVQVTQSKGPGPGPGRIRWSPDGKSLIFDVNTDHGGEVYTVVAAPGQKPVRVLLNGGNASYSHDGKSIYFQSRGGIWKASADGGNPQQLTQDRGGAQPVESADGKYIYYRQRRSFFRMPVTGGDGEEAFVPEHDLSFSTTIQPTKKGIYYAEFERSARNMAISFYDFTTKKSSIVFRMKNTDFWNGAAFSVSPDGKYLLYPRVDQSQTNLILVENFR